MTLTVGSLFSGIGGIDLGLERAGMCVAWQVECDPYARRVLAKNFPGVPCAIDVRLAHGSVRHDGKRGEYWSCCLTPVDVLAGGFPCQDISVAGKGAGIKEGTRSGLWSEFARLVRELRPGYVLVENVPALRSRGLDRVLGDLAACGYDAEWDCFPASAFGAHHQRDRLFVIAYPCGTGAQGLLTGANPSATGPWGRRGEEDLRALADAPFEPGDSWPAPLFRRVDDGLPNRVDRLRALGNAVVPQVAEFVGRCVVEHSRRPI